MRRLQNQANLFRALTAPQKQWGFFLSDLRHGARALAAAPGLTLIALLVTALGIGATTAIFSVVDAVLLRSLPYGHPEKLMYLWSPNTRFQGVPQEMAPNFPDFYDWQRVTHRFSSMTMLRQSAINLIQNGSATRVQAAFVTGSFFQTLAVSPAHGRPMDANDDRPGHERVAVIGNALWRSQFGSDPHIIGKQVQLNRAYYTVIGVMPKDFGFPHEGDIPYGQSGFKQTEIWLPMAHSAAQKTDRTNFGSADATIGRLRDGVSAASAEGELKAIESRDDALYPAIWRGWTASVRPLVQTIIGPVEKMLWLLLGAVSIVLLIAIGNVANLLLARVTARAHEMAIRSALGAGRRRIVRQLLTESLLLSCAGGALGISLAYAAVYVLVQLNPGNIPRFAAAVVDRRVLFTAVVLSIATGLLCGLAPALSASRGGIDRLLRQGGNRGVAGTSNRGRFALIVAEVALSVVLLAASGVLVRSYLLLQTVNPGFSPSTLTFRLNLDDRYNRPELRAAFYKRFLEQLRNMHGVRASGASNSTPLSNHESVSFVDVRGFGKSKEMVETRSITPGYRQALGTPLLRGRDFTPDDVNSKTPLAIVNQSFVKTYFHGGDPLGQQVRTGIGEFSGVPWSTVIGVVGDIRHTKLEEAGQPQIFGPVDFGDNFALQTTVPAHAIVDQARQILRASDPALTLESVRTMSERMSGSNARRRFQTTLFTGFATIAVALALAGLYGLMSYSVKRRTAEIGVRLAVGSSRGGILSLILSQGLRLTALGLLIGLGGAFALTRLIGAWLFGVSPADPVTFVIVPFFVLAVACGACLIPAWSATRVDPIQALREN